MYASERANPRFNVKIPTRVRSLDQMDSTEHSVLASNVSAGGIFFWVGVHLKIGTEVRLFLIMPVEVFGKPVVRWCCDGRIVHTHLNGSPEASLGVGVSFHKCTPDSWVNAQYLLGNKR
jgi:hypothetical protein